MKNENTRRPRGAAGGASSRVCPECRVVRAELDEEDYDEALLDLLRPHGLVEGPPPRVCRCTLRGFTAAQSDAGWMPLEIDTAAAAAQHLARARIPRESWPTKIGTGTREGVGQGAIVGGRVQFRTWVPEWAARVLEIRIEGVYTRSGFDELTAPPGRGSTRLLMAPQRLERVLRLYTDDAEVCSASLTILRLQGEEAFAAFVLSKGLRIADTDVDGA